MLTLRQTLLHYKFNIVWDNILENPLFWKYFLELKVIIPNILKKINSIKHFLDIFSIKQILSYIYTTWIYLNYFMKTFSLNVKSFKVITPLLLPINNLKFLPNISFEMLTLKNLIQYTSTQIILNYYTLGSLYNVTVQEIKSYLNILKKVFFIDFLLIIKFFFTFIKPINEI